MGNWVDVCLDVLASYPDEIHRIERALQEPCSELITWRAQLTGADPQEIAANVKKIVSFKPTRNLGYVHPSVNKARRFENGIKDKFSGLLWSHVHFVSRDYPTAVFLAQYKDDQMSYGGKIVIRAGDEIRGSHDGDHRAQAHEWLLPNIFAPFQAEYELGLDCGSLWNEWLEGMRQQVALLAERYADPAVKSVETGHGKAAEGESGMNDNSEDSEMLDPECGGADVMGFSDGVREVQFGDAKMIAEQEAAAGAALIAGETRTFWVHPVGEDVIYLDCPLCGSDGVTGGGNRFYTQACCYLEAERGPLSLAVERWTAEHLLAGKSIDQVHAALTALRTNPTRRDYVERIHAILHDPRTAEKYKQYLEAGDDGASSVTTEETAHENAANAAELSAADQDEGL